VQAIDYYIHIGIQYFFAVLLVFDNAEGYDYFCVLHVWSVESKPQKYTPRN
jgi:hypothetical protein